MGGTKTGSVVVAGETMTTAGAMLPTACLLGHSEPNSHWCALLLPAHCSFLRQPFTLLPHSPEG